MIKNGQQIDYLDWNPLGSELREGIKNGMDRYFVENYEDEQAPAPGTPVSGYKFFIRVGDNLLSPFAGAPDILLFQMTPEQLALYKRDKVAEEIDEHYEAPITKDSVAVDTTGRGGYYYYGDYGILEDYMRAYMQRNGMEDMNKLPRYQVLEETTLKAGPVTYDRYLNADIINQHNADYLPEEARKFVKPGGSGTTSVTEKSGLFRSTSTYTVKDMIDSMGSIEIYRVEGTAVENTFGDAGLIMNEMKVVGEPIVSIPYFEAAQRMSSIKK